MLFARTPKALARAAAILDEHGRSVLFVTPLLRAREIKMAQGLRQLGWKVVLIYTENTPIEPEEFFDAAILANSEEQAHAFAKRLRPRVCHAFSGAMDELLLRLCRDKPGPLVIDINDVFCPSLFTYCEERFEPTRECLVLADGFCARDLQAQYAARLDGFKLPRHTVLFAEYPRLDAPDPAAIETRQQSDEVRVVSVGTFTLETRGMYDSAYLKLAELLTEQRIHFHIYPHWFYKQSERSSFNWDLRRDFVEFYDLQQRTPYLHIHESAPLDELRRELPQYDFGLIAGGCPEFGQTLSLLTPKYMECCYSGRIADYLEARLPVLINSEVRLNAWLLKHYRIGLDLRGVLLPRFRERLLAAKRDPQQRRNVENAVVRLSLDGQAARLGDFYQQLMIAQQTAPAPDDEMLPSRASPLRSMPVVGPVLRRATRHIDSLKLSLGGLQARLDEATRQLRQAHHQASAAQVENEKLRHEAEGLRVEKLNLQREVEKSSLSFDVISGLLNWPEISNEHQRSHGFDELLYQLNLFNSGATALDHVSSAWNLLGRKNLDQLLYSGYRNFKRTVASNYFTFLVQDGDPQLRFLERALGPDICEPLKWLAETLPDETEFDLASQSAYRYFLLLLLTYARTIDVHRHLDRVAEPEEGNPITIQVDGRRISQDLINSVLEYYSLTEAAPLPPAGRVLEIGGGYGRNAFLTLQLNPDIQYTLVDIPPALYLAQRYLSSVFPHRRVFRVQDFQEYRRVENELGEASLIFLLPHQLRLMPDKHFAAALNISSFGEMQRDVISGYFDEIDRLTGGVFYMKQWQVSKNPFDALELTADDYPIKAHWEQLYRRSARVQADFFEAAYRIGGCL